MSEKTRLPSVAILGRPNVGKSTLFNALSGSRDAISLNTPGITRDRHVTRCKIGDKAFLLIDTGGFEAEPEDNIFEEIRGQIWKAIDESDFVILLLDGAEGLTHDDRDIFNTLRGRGKSFVTVVNKIDHPSHDERLYEFYELGVSELVGISAEHKRNLDELRNKIIESIPSVGEIPRDEDRIKLAILGRPNVGKSSLLNKLIGDYRVIVSEVPGTTRDSIDTDFSFQGQDYTIIDTAGIKRKGKTKTGVEKISVIKALDSIDRSNISILLLDASEGVTDQDAHILGYILEAGKGVIIAVNKWDLLEKKKDAVDDFMQKTKYKLKFAGFAPLICISAKTGQRIFKILELAREINKNSKFRIPTSEYNRLIQSTVNRHPLPIYNKKRVKIYYSTQISVEPPTFVLITNYKEGIHFSYLRYIENTIRENYDFEGVPIRILVRSKKRS